MFEKETEEYRKDLKSKFFLSEPQLDLACQGFKDGFSKAKEWHDLRENPDDLPPMIEDERKISQDVWLHVKNWGSESGYYSYRKNVWMVRCREVNLPVLGWTEIPKFREE